MRNRNIKYRIHLFLLGIILICGVLLFFLLNHSKEEKHIEYRAQNEFVTIEIHSFSDLETFEKWKPSDMTIISSLVEEEKQGNRLVVGSICMDNDYFQEEEEYRLQIEKENGNSFYIPLLIKEWERSNGNMKADFFVIENTELRYEYLTLLNDQEELVKFQLKK